VFATGDYAVLSGVHELGKTLFAFGRAGKDELGLWRTTAGDTWVDVPTPPVLPEGRGGRITQILGAVGDGLMAAAVFGNPEGGGIEGTALYFSEDGESWAQVGDPTPGLAVIAGATARLIVARTTPAADEFCKPAEVSFGISSDRGSTWQASSDVFTGVVLSMTTTSTQIVAAGYDCRPSPVPIIWTSLDGQSWQETAIDTEGSASVAVGVDSGDVLVLGERAGEGVAWRHLGGQWAAIPLGECCLRSAALTQSGLVAAGSPATGGDSYLATSVNLSQWTAAKTFREGVNAVGWTQMLGFVVATDAGSLLVHPEAYP
jgi:hypothetical protein